MLVDTPRIEHICGDQQDHAAIIADQVLDRRMDYLHRRYPQDALPAATCSTEPRKAG
jgi:hypothetical protein